ncbi:MAG: hypothetical protein ACRCSP_09645 [Rhodoglobus sp.]
MADLKIDYDELRTSLSHIDAATSSFLSAEKVGNDIAGLVGHSGLSSTVDDFANAWDINRERLQTGLQFVLESLTSIIDTFRELDAAQAEAITTNTPQQPGLSRTPGGS